jgi:hypothetical protein
MSNVQRKCQCCRNEFTARSADVKRGWAKYCSKSCKAKKQEARTGQYRDYKQRTQPQERGNYGLPMFTSAHLFDNTGYDR